MSKIEAKPFLKWAGGKSQLLSTFENYYPQRLIRGEIDTYIEPFAGAGAVFFNIQRRFNFQRIILNDINSELIRTYNVIKNDVEHLIEILEDMENTYLNAEEKEQENIYYETRDAFNKEKEELIGIDVNSLAIKNAAKMIFLNKTCFNGLYRENKKGGFNVPFGKRKKVTICDKTNLLNVNKALQGVTLQCGDFQELTKFVSDKTYIYIDPPYRPLTKTSAFTDYSKVPFNDEEQKRLAKWTYCLNDLGAAFMLSNSDPKNANEEDEFFDDLYKPFFINRVSASRAINSKGTGRSKINEILVCNEEPINQELAAFAAIAETKNI